VLPSGVAYVIGTTSLNWTMPADGLLMTSQLAWPAAAS
jgi:hypothetical protein